MKRERKGEFALCLSWGIAIAFGQWCSCSWTFRLGLDLALLASTFLGPLDSDQNLHTTITHIPSNYVLPTIWASLSPVELTHKIITGVHEPLNSTQAWVERRERSLGGQARP